jgi:hypothetical protein
VPVRRRAYQPAGFAATGGEPQRCTATTCCTAAERPPGRVAGAADYPHHVSRNVSAFAQGWAGAERAALDRWRGGYSALGELRVES